MGGTRLKKEVIINNSPNSELADSRKTGPLLEIHFIEEGGSGIFGSAVSYGASFCMSSMDG